MLIAILLATVLLAAANGANDNIKGAATLVGSGLIGFRSAIALATAATACGGLASIVIANGLIAAFSGKGIVPDGVITQPSFLLSVALGAGLTVAVASRIGMPVSTTHALLGALVGAGLGAAASDVAFAAALQAMALPLIVSPLLALTLALAILPLLSRWRTHAQPTTVCVCSEDSLAADAGAIALALPALTVATADAAQCQPRAGRSVRTLPLGSGIDRMHLLSAAAVSFARGLNDTPKIAALVVAAGVLGVGGGSLLVVVSMTLGGLLAARRVAQTLAFGVTTMDAGQGLGANLVTSTLVIVASRFGLPVSTTHVSTGALFGIVASNGSGRAGVIRNILVAWLLTLPLAAAFAYLSHLIIA